MEPTTRAQSRKRRTQPRGVLHTTAPVPDPTAPTVSSSATLGHSGAVTFSASADLLAAKPEFAGKLAIRGWKVAELYALEDPATKLQTPKGTLDLFAEFKARDGAISGGVKPVLSNVEVRPTWPTVLGIVRNAFVEGISAGFAHLPPGVAPEKEGVLTQAKHALQNDQGPPKAQPPKTDPGSGKK